MEHEDKGLTVIDFILIAKGFFLSLKKRRAAVLIIIFISSGIGFISTFFGKKPDFIATSTLMLENTKSGGMSGALALASQLGLAGGGGDNVALSGDKLLDIIKAETIIKTALFEKTTIDSITDILANHFIRLFDYNELWKKNDSLKGFKFMNAKDKLTTKENGVFKTFHGRIISDFLKIEESKKSGIIMITVSTPSALFSKYFNESLVRSVSSFYVDRITEKERKNVGIVQKRVDSIAGALRDAELAFARWKDSSNQLVKAKGMINEIRLRRDVEVANSIYIEGIKQLEISKFALLEQTPVLQIIDKPSLPLAQTPKFSKIKAVALSFIAGCILAGLFVYGLEKYFALKEEFKKQ